MSAPSVPVGFIGLGAMGGPIARRLATLGLPLHVYDINRRAVQSVVDCGAKAAALPNLDAPLTGTGRDAERGTLTVIVSGLKTTYESFCNE